MSKSKDTNVLLQLLNTSDSVLELSHLNSLDPISFDELNPQQYADWYLHSCYPEVPFHDEKAILEFLVNEAPTVKGCESLLELGCGPVISHALPFVPYVKSFTLSDYLDSNLQYISHWLKNEPDAHNWRIHTAFVLRKEGQHPSQFKIDEREASLRNKVTSLIVGDLLSRRPIRKPLQFPIVTCFYATEQAASDETEWLEVIQNLSSLISPGGHLFLSCLHNTDFYAIHDTERVAVTIPIVPISERLINKALLRSGFSMKQTKVDVQAVSGLKEEGIEGVILVHARKAD